jgi:hypothetical protein
MRDRLRWLQGLTRWQRLAIALMFLLILLTWLGVCLILGSYVV